MDSTWYEIENKFQEFVELLKFYIAKQFRQNVVFKVITQVR